MASPEVILVAHYDSDALSSLRKIVEDDGFRVQATSSGADVLKRADPKKIDAIVMDPMLQRVNGLQVLKSLKESRETARIPVLMLADDGDTYTEGRATATGADGILHRSADGSIEREALGAKLRVLLASRAIQAGKPRPETGTSPLERLLTATIESVRAENPIVGHLTDALTGLFNVAYFDLKLAEEFKRCRRFQIPLTLVYLKLIASPSEAADDRSGPWRQVLNEAAGVLLCECRDIDILGRVDGQSFSLLLPHTDAKGAIAMAQRVLGHTPRVFEATDEKIDLRAVMGLFCYEGTGVDAPEELKRRATVALGVAARRSAESYVVWTPELEKNAG